MFDKQTLGIKDLQLSIYEGWFAVILLTAGVSFVVPFAVYLGANAFEVSFLAAFPALFAAWAQLLSVKLLEKFGTRKWPIIVFTFLQALFFLPIAFIPFISAQHGVFWLVIFYTLSTVIGALGGPLWQSWMKALIPDKILGSYFGFRNAVVGLASFVFLLIFGLSLRVFSAETSIVFVGIFILSSFGRFVSSFIFTKITENTCPFYLDKPEGFIDFLLNLKKSNFGVFILFGSLMSFAIALTGPFVSFHLLNNIGLKNDYFTYTLIVSSATIAAFLAMPYWGKLIDRYGTIKVLKAASLLAAFFPLLYVFVRFPLGLIAVQFIDGLIFSGFNLASANFIYNVSNQNKIIRYASYQAVFFGTATFLGALLSGFIQNTGITFFILVNSFFVMCFVTFILRFFIYKLLINKINEVRPVEEIESRKIVFSILTFAPVVETVSESVIPFENSLKEVKVNFEKRLVNLEKFIEVSSKVVEKKAVDFIKSEEEEIISKERKWLRRK